MGSTAKVINRIIYLLGSRKRTRKGALCIPERLKSQRGGSWQKGLTTIILFCYNLIMNNTCKHTFKDEYGYCPNCGQTIKVLTQKQIARKSTNRQPEYMKNSEVNHYMKVAAETVELFSELYNIEIDLHGCNRDGAYHTMERGRHQIYLGVGYMQHISEVGFVDYRADWVFHSIGRQKGDNAVKALVAHEFAHAIQVENGQRSYGQMHGRYWESKYYELVQLTF